MAVNNSVSAWVQDVTIVPDRGWRCLRLRALGFPPALYANGLAELAKLRSKSWAALYCAAFWGWFRP